MRSGTSPCGVPIATGTELEPPTERLRHFQARSAAPGSRSFLHHTRPLHERLWDAQARVQVEHDRVQRNQAAVVRAQQSLDLASEKLAHAKETLTAIQREVFREFSCDSAFFSGHLGINSVAITQMLQRTNAIGRPVSLNGKQISALASCFFGPRIAPLPDFTDFTEPHGQAILVARLLVLR